MKRSEYLALLDLAYDMKSSADGGGWFFDDAEASYAAGQDSRAESDAERVEDFLDTVVVDVEDVTLCSGELSFYKGQTKRAQMHELGALPFSGSGVGDGYGCRKCLEWRAAVIEKEEGWR